MSGFAQVLLEDYSGRLDADGIDSLQEIHTNAVRMGSLIDALLSLARVTRSDPNPEWVDLSEVGEQIRERLALADPVRHVDVVVQPGLRAFADPALARNLVANLMDNAWKFTSNIAQARIEFGSTDEDGVTTFFVRDNGAGFDMAHADKLFAPFQRLHTVGEFPGTGIGLATAQRIVYRHNGRIWARANVGEGATFCFTLPTSDGGGR